MPELPGQIDEEVLSWLQSALEDVRIARRCLLDPPAVRGFFYHVQQAAEKSLKAHLLALEGSAPPRTHLLRDLAKLIGQSGGAPPQAEAMAFLDAYAVGVRYPDTYVPPLEQSGSALTHAERVIQHVLDQLGLPTPGDESSQAKLKW